MYKQVRAGRELFVYAGEIGQADILEICGKATLKNLALDMIREFGKDFDGET